MSIQKLDWTILEAAHKTATGVDLIPLHILDAPIVAGMQEQIRHQHALIASMGKAIQYSLARINGTPELLQVFYLTESHDRLVTALAQMMREPRERIAEMYHAHHDAREDYGCIDDPEEAI